MTCIEDNSPAHVRATGRHPRNTLKVDSVPRGAKSPVTLVRRGTIARYVAAKCAGRCEAWRRHRLTTCGAHRQVVLLLDLTFRPLNDAQH